MLRWSRAVVLDPGVRAIAVPATHAGAHRSGVPGFEHRQSPSRRDWRAPKNGPQALGRSRGGWTTKLHLVAADERHSVTWSLTPGQAGDAPEGRRLIQALGPLPRLVALLMDSAYQDDATRELAYRLGSMPVVPPNPQRRQPWAYDRQRYCKRNQIERLFRRLKAWRRVFTRYDKLDLMFAAFIMSVLIAEALR